MSKLRPEGPTKPFLRWAGSKRQLIPKLSKYWNNDYRRYVEPFVGSASLFFGIRPSSALLGDLNEELIATFGQVKSNQQEVVTALNTMRKGRNNYLRMRAINPSTLTPVLRAARFIYLNRFCFNGLYRTNRAGKFNVPYGGNKAGALPSSTALSKCSSCLQVAELFSGSFEVTLEKVIQGDFVYLDPPFSVKARRVFNEYDASQFNEKHLKRLRQWMQKLDRRGIPFLVSYAESEEGAALSKGFSTEVVGVKRNIAGFAANRRSANELLISNARTKAHREDL